MAAFVWLQGWNDQFEEADTQVLGISTDARATQTAFAASLGNIPYPVLSDFHPKGKASQSYDLYNEERGASKRAVIIIDKEGVIRFREEYEPGTLPNPVDIFGVMEGLS